MKKTSQREFKRNTSVVNDLDVGRREGRAGGAAKGGGRLCSRQPWSHRQRSPSALMQLDKWMTCWMVAMGTNALNFMHAYSVLTPPNPLTNPYPPTHLHPPFRSFSLFLIFFFFHGWEDSTNGWTDSEQHEWGGAGGAATRGAPFYFSSTAPPEVLGLAWL